MKYFLYLLKNSDIFNNFEINFVAGISNSEAGHVIQATAYPTLPFPGVGKFIIQTLKDWSFKESRKGLNVEKVKVKKLNIKALFL